MKTILPILLTTVSLTISCTTDEDIPSDENIVDNAVEYVLKKSVVIDDGQLNPATEYFYNSNNQITSIVYGTPSVSYWTITDVIYNNNNPSIIEFTNPNGTWGYQVSTTDNVISLTSTIGLIEIDYTGDYVDNYRKYNNGSTNPIIEINFIRDANNNLTSQTISTASETTTYNYSNHDSSNSMSGDQPFSNDYWFIFGLKATENNPMTKEFSINGNTPIQYNSNLIYNDQNNVINWTESVIEFVYEYEEI